MTDKIAVVPRLDPQALIAKAIEKDVDVGILERLVELAKDVRRVTAREAFFEAMADFKRKCPRITKDATANTGRYSYKYATLDSILDTVEPILTDQGLTVSWRQKHEGQAVHASCVITHRLGHQEESGFIAMPFDAAGQMNPAQRVGSAATYAKRYSLLAVLGIAPEDDDDARGSDERPPRGTSEAAPVRTESTSQPLRTLEAESNPLEETKTALKARIAKFTLAKIILLMHRLDLGDGEWINLDVAALDLLAKSLEGSKK